ncbi:TolC family protein [Elongatibacter sediminis]|uniref:TolC family protein n=1 Tax=Elongatibacter sediminis TaxID=3119006 RepID=A0AAW9RBA3_9GAMM
MLRFLIVCFALTAPWSALAATLTLEDALERALTSHPDLQSRQAETDALAADRDHRALPTHWSAGVEYESAPAPGGGSGLDDGELTLRLSRLIERGGKRDLRQAAGQARVDYAALEMRLRRLELAAETVRRFTAAIAAHDRLALAGEQLELATHLLRQVEHRVAAARSPAAEEYSARAELGRARASLAHQEGARAAAWAGLAALWGGEGPEIDTLEGDLFALPTVPDATAVRQSLQRNPDVLRQVAATAVASAESALARATQTPDISASAGLRYFGETDDAGFVLEFSLPLGTASRAEPAVRAAEQRTTASHLAQTARLREVNGVAMRLLAELEARRNELQIYQESVIPEARAAVEAYRLGFEAGRHSFLTVADAQRRLSEARAQAIATAAAFHRLMTELEQLTYTVQGEQP